MYANLRVTTRAGKKLAAWKVEVDPQAGTTNVYLDDPEDESSYAVERGMLKLRGPVRVEADW